MRKSRNPESPLPPPKGKKVVVTSELFEAYLACPTKCFLRFTGEMATGNTIATWNHTRSESYRHDGTRRLTADYHQMFGSSSTERGRWKNAPWRFAYADRVSAHNLEASPHAIQRIPPEGARKAPQLVPVRFTPPNKLSRSDKLMAGFDALVLSKAFDVKVGLAKIIHGHHGKVFKLKTNTMSREVNKTVSEITALLSAPSPPALILNRHCPECDFQGRCQKRIPPTASH